jgi:hypothetical protein
LREFSHSGAGAPEVSRYDDTRTVKIRNAVERA